MAQSLLGSVAFYPDFAPLSPKLILRVIAYVLPNIALAAAAFWFASRADEEIYSAQGRFGGVAFCTAARVMAAISVIAVVGLTLMNLAVRIGPEAFEPSNVLEVPDPLEADDVPSGVEFFGPTPPAPPAASAGE